MLNACMYAVSYRIVSGSIYFAVTRVLMKIFNTRSRDITEQCQLMFGMLPVADQVFMRKVRFLVRFTHNENLIYSVTICQQCFE